MSQTKNKHNMDSRCPKQLTDLPSKWCPLAVQRLKAIRNYTGNLSEEKEANLPGCPWAVAHQLANYCFFNLIKNHMPDNKDLSDMEIAHFCGVSIDTIKKSEKKALDKIRKTNSFEEIADKKK